MRWRSLSTRVGGPKNKAIGFVLGEHTEQGAGDVILSETGLEDILGKGPAKGMAALLLSWQFSVICALWLDKSSFSLQLVRTYNS